MLIPCVDNTKWFSIVLLFTILKTGCGGTFDSSNPINSQESIKAKCYQEGAIEQLVKITSVIKTSDNTITYHGCSGTLIGKSTVLTAAHCVLDSDCQPSDFITVERRFEDRTLVEEVLVHDSFDCIRDKEKNLSLPEHFDVALLKLLYPIVLVKEGHSPQELLEPPYVEIATHQADRKYFWSNSARCKGEWLYDESTGEPIYCHATHKISPSDLSKTSANFWYENHTGFNTCSNEHGDSGGPVFSEKVILGGEKNDGMGGTIGKPVLYALQSKLGYEARLDPIRDWIVENTE